MKQLIVIYSLLVLLGVFKFANAQKITNFTLKDAVSQKDVSLASFNNKKGVVIIFTSNYCPYSKLYEKRIQELANSYQNKGIQFLLLNANKGTDDTFEEMTKRAKSKSYNVPYLADKNQEVANALYATKTPEAFLLKYSNNNFTVFYKGPIDNNPQVETDVSEAYLKKAIDALLTNQTTTNKRPTGCMIKK